MAAMTPSSNNSQENSLPQSWGEHIRAIKREKVSLPWKPGEFVRNQRVTTFDLTRQERQFDPVLQKFRDPRVEVTRAQVETAYRTEVLNRSHARERKYGQPYNILTHTPVQAARATNDSLNKTVPVTLGVATAERLKEIERTKRLRASRVDYNIVSNLSTQEHHWAPPSQRPSPLPKSRHGSGPAPPTVESSATKKRDYNILSGKYLNHHKKRTAIDKKFAADKAATRFWQTHDFNPVSCKFYDGKKEELFKEAREVFEKSHGAVQRRRLPPKVRDSEGYLFDIVTMRPKDMEKLRMRDANSTRGTSDTNKAVVEQKIRERCEARYDVLENRKLNRVAAKRFDEITKNGYDLVTGQSFHGPDSKRIPRPIYMAKPPSIWQKASAGRGIGKGQVSSRIASKSSTPKLVPLEPAAHSSTVVHRGAERSAASTPTGAAKSTLLQASGKSILSATERPVSVPRLDLDSTKGSTSKVRTGGFQ